MKALVQLNNLHLFFVVYKLQLHVTEIAYHDSSLLLIKIQ